MSVRVFVRCLALLLICVLFLVNHNDPHTGAPPAQEKRTTSSLSHPQASVRLTSTPAIVIDEKVAERAVPPIRLEDLTIMNRGMVPLDTFDHLGFKDVVFAVLSDGILQDRLHAALSSWLRDTFHTFVYFSDVPLSRAAAARFEASNVTIRFLKPPASFRFGNWKNLPIVKDLMSQDSQNILRDLHKPHSPRWYVIVDDDTYLMQPAVQYLLTSYTRQLDENPDRMLYLGHTVMHCGRCRTASKRFPFAFGGNGIFMSPALTRRLAEEVNTCAPMYYALPGDEQIGGCIHRYRLTRLNHLSVGTETFSMAFGDKAEEVLPEAPFPFSFHRIKFPHWHVHMRILEDRHRGKILTWPVLANFFMVEYGHVFNRNELVFQETLNTTAVQNFLMERRRL